ncbi:MAG: universal stress protein [Archangium sp.]|nr:universal stress protein [Archangium sp.]
MKSVIVAVDGSEPSLKGVKLAASLAVSMGARLELVHVIPPVLLPPSSYAEAIAKVEAGGKAIARELLDKAAAVATEAGAQSDSVMLHGSPAESIADLATAERVWGVVIGARGHSAVSRVLLGSVVDRLVHICTKPVLVVR